MSSVFVTGATGFIGQRLVNKLKDRGERVKVLSRTTHPEFETVVCDLQRDEIPGDALVEVETVFHLAGLAHDLRDAAMVEPLYRRVNVDATVRLAELALASGVQKFVFVSSVKAGGHLDGASEGIYGKTKREAELRLLEISQKSSMHVAIVRPSLVYGARVKGNLALMLRRIEKGWFPPLPETGNRRSMIHVLDLVRAVLFLAENYHANGEIFIATDGVPHSSREIYEAICHAVGKPIPNWSVPKFLFNVLAKTSPKLRYKVDKLLGDEYYSSAKLEAIGFKAERTLFEMKG
jgi:UDP-glucose 4-epimerase